MTSAVCHLVLMRWIGIEFDPNVPISKTKKHLSFLIALVFFSLNVYSNTSASITTISGEIRWNSSSNVPELSTYFWSVALYQFDYDLLVVGSHAVLLSLRWRSKWKILWQNFKKMTENVQNTNQLKKKCHTFIFSGFLIFIAVNSI